MFYQGGEGIDRFRTEPGGHRGPEDWVASMCRLPTPMVGPDAPPDAGLSTTVDGRLLVDLVQADPVGWLGATLARRYDG
ncbi:MAG: hypothetical protein ABI862_09580, partial [Ilumatobacteraceae bacterium]